MLEWVWMSRGGRHGQGEERHGHGGVGGWGRQWPEEFRQPERRLWEGSMISVSLPEAATGGYREFSVGPVFGPPGASRWDCPIFRQKSSGGRWHFPAATTPTGFSACSRLAFGRSRGRFSSLSSSGTLFCRFLWQNGDLQDETVGRRYVHFINHSVGAIFWGPSCGSF